MVIDEDLIVEGAKACALAVGCYGGPGGGYMCSDPLDDNCECGKYTRAALTAILPVVEERERERAARIAERFSQFSDTPQILATAIRHGDDYG